MSGDEKMTRWHFNLFTALILLSLFVTFLLFLYSPNDHQDFKVVDNFQYRSDKSLHWSAQDTLDDADLRLGMDEDIGDEEKDPSNHQLKPPAIDVDKISPGKLSDRDLIYQAKDVGLTVHNREFLLSRKPFRILSGSIHYFRLMPEHWRDRLLKLKACGLNTVET